MEYQIVRGPYKAYNLFGKKNISLADKVEELIKKGWEPLGGIGVHGSLYVQAMIKK